MLLKSRPFDAATSLDIALILYLLGREVLATREIAGSAGLFRLHPHHRPKSPILKGGGAGIGKLTLGIRGRPNLRHDWLSDISSPGLDLRTQDCERPR